MKSFILMVVAMVCAISLEAQNKSFYDFTVQTIDGKEFPLFVLERKESAGGECGLQVWLDTTICQVAGIVREV